MVRFILGFVGARLRGRAADLVLQQRRRPISRSPPAATAEEEFHLHPKHLALASDGPFGKFDQQAAAARLPGLQGSLLGLPQPEPRRVPRPRSARLQRGRSEGDRQPVADRSSVGESGDRRAGDPQGASVRSLPEPVCERDCGARGEQQCASARPVADDQGARWRRGLRLFAADRLSAAAGRAAARSSRPRRRRRGCTTTPISRT